VGNTPNSRPGRVPQNGRSTCDAAAMAGTEGRVAVVTGVSRRIGIGAGIARRLASGGWRLVLHAWAPHDAEQPWGADSAGPAAIVDDVRGWGADAIGVDADFADPDAPARVVRAAAEAFGHVDAVIANHARSGIQSLEQLTAAELQKTLAVNVTATLLLVQAFAAQHDGRAGGRVVLFTSGQYHGAMPAELPYIASKAALRGLTPSLAVHLAPRDITVNCVDPGPNDTGYADDEERAWLAARNPGGRWGTPEDAARLVAWLVSDEAAWVTGQTIASDGGWSALGGVAGT
jgi:3-oxoacyl-[acyl-carrier protein] reductase